MRLDRASFEVGTDEVTLYNPGQVQSCRGDGGDGGDGGTAPWTCVSLYLTPPRIGELASAVGLSREALIRVFTRATGSPQYAWHLQARLAEGRRLLRAGRPVAEVAHALGFADQAHFHKHFRAAYAITPGRYRVNI